MGEVREEEKWEWEARSERGGEVNSGHMHPPVPGPWQAGEK